MTIAPYNVAFTFDKTETLSLLFGTDYNGDVYDTSDPSNPKLICSSGRPFIKVKHRKEIQEKILRTAPSFDATLIRLFWHNGKWYMATRKHIDAFDNTWPPSPLSFGELFEHFVAFDKLDAVLNQDEAYTFLLIAPELQNVLPNDSLELLHVYTFNRVTQKHEANPIQKPHFARKIVCSRITGWLEDVKMAKLVDGEEKTKRISITKMTRPQRGWLFTGESRRVYQLDFHFYENMENIIQNRPWKMVFFDLLKKKVTDKPMEISLDHFFEFYKNENFLAKWLYLQHIAKYICQCYNQGVTPSQPTVRQIWEHVLARNKRITLAESFVLRQIVFQKYVVLDALLASQFYPALINAPPLVEITEEDCFEGAASISSDCSECNPCSEVMKQEEVAPMVPMVPMAPMAMAQEQQEQEQEPLKASEVLD